MATAMAISTEVTEEEKKLSLEEKLALIDNEIQTIYNMCVKSGFTPNQIEKCARPLIEPVKKVERRKLVNKVLLIGFVLATAFALFYYDHPIRKFTVAVVRIATIKVLPYWDWSKHYDDLCLVKNPYYRRQQRGDDLCRGCENFSTIDRLSNADPHNISESYMFENTPFIVTDALKSWPATEKFGLSFLNELYETNEVLKNDKPCFVKSNIRLKPGQHRKLLKKSADGKVDDWFMYWDNCELNATKVFRQFYRRPYFMPNMVEMTSANWLLTVKNYEAQHHKLFVSEHVLTWFAQIRGKTDIKLEPAETCDSVCESFEFTLSEGEILVVMNDLWYLFFRPTADTESIAIASGGNFDE